MNAAEIKNLYIDTLNAYEKAQHHYRVAQRKIGSMIAKKKDFHRNDYVSSIMAITDDGIIHYGVAANDSDVTGDGTIHISEIEN